MIIFRRRSKSVTCPPRTPDPRGRACDVFEGSGGSNLLSSHNGRSPRPTPPPVLPPFCLTNFGLRPPLLHQVARATTVTSLLYVGGLQPLRRSLGWRGSG